MKKGGPVTRLFRAMESHYPSYIGILISQYKDPVIKTTRMTHGMSRVCFDHFLNFMDPSVSFLCQVNCTIGSTSGGLWMSPDGPLGNFRIVCLERISSHQSGAPTSYK